MANVLKDIGTGSTLPTGMVQFGNKYIVCYADKRPVCIMPTGASNILKAYDAGIKAPVVAPTLANSTTAASNLQNGDVVTMAFCWYSTERKTFSRLSPTASHTVSSGKKIKLSVATNDYPLDQLENADIDRLVICAQHATNTGLMTVWSDMTLALPATQAAWVSAGGVSIDFDKTAAQLELGFDMSAADPYYEVPYAFKYVARHGERLWFCGQTESSIKIAASLSAVVAAVPASYRGTTVDQITATVASVPQSVWTDADIGKSFYLDGKYYGEVWGWSGYYLYLDRSNTGVAGYSGTEVILVGHNDRLYPSSYHGHNSGNYVISYPESINPADYQLLANVLDSGEKLKGIVGNQGIVNIIFNDSETIMTGGYEVGSPQPYLRTNMGKTGAIAQRSICKDQEGSINYVGEEGFIKTNTGGVNSIAHELGINQLFKGGQWISAASLPTIVMAYSRQYDGFIVGNLTVDSTANHWGILSLRPQYGFFLFNGQEIKSNIVEYQDSNGQGVILVGDSYGGRVKRLLDPTVLTDVPTDSDTASAFSCNWREGWQSDQSGMPVVCERLRMLGFILPGTTLAMTLAIWHNNYPVRDQDDVASANKHSTSLTHANLFYDIGFIRATARYWSVGFTWNSNSGASGVDPVEIGRWQLVFENDGGAADD